jgi:hypothetical protein
MPIPAKFRKEASDVSQSDSADRRRFEMASRLLPLRRARRRSRKQQAHRCPVKTTNCECATEGHPFEGHQLSDSPVPRKLACSALKRLVPQRRQHRPDARDQMLDRVSVDLRHRTTPTRRSNRAWAAESCSSSIGCSMPPVSSRELLVLFDAPWARAAQPRSKVGIGNIAVNDFCFG